MASAELLKRQTNPAKKDSHWVTAVGRASPGIPGPSGTPAISRSISTSRSRAHVSPLTLQCNPHISLTLHTGISTSGVGFGSDTTANLDHSRAVDIILISGAPQQVEPGKRFSHANASFSAGSSQPRQMRSQSRTRLCVASGASGEFSLAGGRILFAGQGSVLGVAGSESLIVRCQ
ncbi:hypothetical protein ASPVEDRAFT_330425 [Aspergillus versicolor CBS 583.65]|uniref:Uncharacterized protein n=1 Tax=Aspergillus versicolor CBS 583.65 TaxID=1036611 RepID=A0A1L9PYM0_ASPVE|nr:uncharacterized protein ASPVEDRAFT_330425 [Aspergillus versicolor CBS 583.65]OJJ06617.1 hypothetical protein ASPVEDRAFT_330425 [Aspergillus versicolor CBS 583.65]